MEYAIESPNANCRKFLESLMPSIIEQLSLTNSKKAVLVRIANDLPAGFEGATLNIDIADCYLVLIKLPARLSKTKLLNMATTLSHEMVHVRQLAKGLLKFKRNNSREWMGKHYSAKTKYLDMPWELDALSRQEILLRRAVDA